MGLIDSLKSGASSLADRATSAAGRAKDAAIETASSVKEAATESAQAGLERVAHTIDTVGKKMDKLTGGAARQVGIHDAHPKLAEEARRKVKQSFLTASTDARPPELKKAMPLVAKRVDAAVDASSLAPHKSLRAIDEMIKRGDYDAAEQALAELEKKSGQQQTSLLPEPQGPRSSDKVSYKGADFDVRKNGISVGELVAGRRAQIGQLREMKRVLGGKVPDPQNAGQMREYFLAVSKPPATTKQVAAEYRRYLDNFYGTATGGEGRGIARWPMDAANRRRMNCVAHSDLTRQIFKGNPRFELKYAARNDNGHEYAIVVDKTTKESIRVDINYAEGDRPERVSVFKTKDAARLAEGDDPSQFTVSGSQREAEQAARRKAQEHADRRGTVLPPELEPPGD